MIAPTTTPPPPPLRCLGRTEFDPFRRTSECSYTAEYIGLPSEVPACLAHAIDFARTRDIAPIDHARAACRDCLAISASVYSLSPGERRRRGKRGELPSSRWCSAHERAA